MNIGALKEGRKTESLLILYVGFFVVSNLAGLSFLSDVAWAPYVNTQSNSEAPAGAIWVEDQNFHWANGSNENFFSPPPSLEGAEAVYNLDSGSGSIATDNSWRSEVYGIKRGYESGNLNFVPNQWGGSSNTGEIDITCSGGDSNCEFTRDGATYSGTDISSINNGIATNGVDKGTRYIMYSAESVHNRFSSNPPHSDNSDHFIGVHYENGWYYDDNGNFHSFTPRNTDILVAKFNGDASSNEGSITYANSTEGIEGTLNGPTWTSGRFNNGLSFDGSNDIVDLTGLEKRDFQSTASITAWVKLNSATPSDSDKTGLYHIEGSGSSNTHYPWTDGTAYFSTFRDNRIDSISLSSNVDRTNWHLVTITTEPGTNGWKLYQNTELVYETSGENEVSIEGLPTLGSSEAGHYLNGQLDEVRIYDRVLSSNEIESIYRGAGSRTGGTPGSIWVENSGFRWIDQNGFERGHIASDTGNNPSGGSPGSIWLEGGSFRYIDSNGNERLVSP